MEEPTQSRRPSLDLSKLIEGVVAKKTTLQLNLAEELPRIEADAGQVRQAVLNLIADASASRDARGGAIQVSTGIMWAEDGELPSIEAGRILPAGLYVYVEVAGAGDGPDLAAVRDLVRGLGGSIQASSQPGAGTAVRLLFPALEE